jgi:hypothetical protein
VLSQIPRYRELLTPVSPKQGTGVKYLVWDTEGKFKGGTGVSKPRHRCQGTKIIIWDTENKWHRCNKIKAPVSKHKIRDTENKRHRCHQNKAPVYQVRTRQFQADFYSKFRAFPHHFQTSKDYQIKFYTRNRCEKSLPQLPGSRIKAPTSSFSSQMLKKTKYTSSKQMVANQHRITPKEERNT